jgi:hypothetical protein
VLWGSVVLAVSVAVLLVAGNGRQADPGVRLSDTTETLLAALEETRANALGGPEVWNVAEATAALVHLEAAARQLFDLAGQLDSGDRRLREETASIAAGALDLERLIGDDWIYRLAVRPFWETPQLPAAGDSVQLAEVLAAWQIVMTDAVNGVVPPGQYSDHLAEVERFLSGFDEWRTSYLDAIASSDTSAASDRVAQLETVISQLKDGLSSAEVSLRAEATARLEQIEKGATVLGQ